MRNLRPNVSFDCVVCRAHVKKYVVPSRLATLPPQVCSRRCQGRLLSGASHPMWRGGRKIEGGYVHVYQPDHPHANKKGCVPEHRLVMEGLLGRVLSPEEVVHHENDDGLDNRPENLRLFPDQAAHKAYEHAARVRDTAGRYLPVGASA